MAEIRVERLAYVRKRLSRAFGALSFATAIVPVVALALLSSLGTGALQEALLRYGVWCALLFAGVSYLAARALYSPRGSIRREGDDVVFARGKRLLRMPLGAVREGIVVPEKGRVRVELELAGGDQIEARVRDVASAEELLKELRVDVGNQRCRVRVADPTAARVVARIAPVTLALFGALAADDLWRALVARIPGDADLPVAVGLYAVLAALLQALIATPDVTVGIDGLSFRAGFRERFIPYGELEHVRVGGFGVSLWLRGGRRVRLFSLVGASATRVEALKLRIREAIAARGAAPALGLSQLDRGGRSVREWRAALAALAKPGAAYRATGLSTEDLEALLVSPDASAERRLGAAVALVASRHPGAPERIRVAAAQCANERLRVALERVGEGDEDDAAIAEALDEPAPRRAQVPADA